MVLVPKAGLLSGFLVVKNNFLTIVEREIMVIAKKKNMVRRGPAKMAALSSKVTVLRSVQPPIAFCR